MKNKTKIIIGFNLLLLVLIIIKLFLSGYYLNNILEELIPNIIVFLIVSVVLMLIPLIFRIINKDRLEYKIGNIICLFNSIILYIIFSIPNIITITKGNENIELMSIDPVSFSKSLIIIYLLLAIIYYFINMCFFVNSKIKSTH